MGNDDITVLVLREIRDEMKGMREEQKLMRGEITETNVRLASLEAHVASEIVGLRADFVAARVTASSVVKKISPS